MSSIHAGSIVVGVDGSAPAERALFWAAEEASHRTLPLTVVHAGDITNEDHLTPETFEAVTQEVSDFATTLLADAVDSLAEEYPTVEVTTVLREGSPAEVLTELSFGATLVVVGRGEHSWMERLVIGSNARRVANEAHCPVVVVSEQLPDPSGPVVVGVSPTANGLQAMRTACEEARLRCTSVVAVRSWTDLTWGTAALDFSITSPLRSIEHSQQAVLDLLVDSFREGYRDVEIERQLTAQPTDIALSSVPDAGLLVIGRRRDLTSRLSRLGPTSSWLIEHTDYPVMVVGDDVTPPADDLETLRRAASAHQAVEAAEAEHLEKAESTS